MALRKKQQRFIERNRGKLSPAELAARLKASRKEVEAYCRELEETSGTPDIDPQRKRVFSLIAALIPVVVLVLLEVALRAGQYGGNLDLFITAPDEYSHYYMCNPFVGRRYFFMQSSLPTPPNDIFLKEKPANGYRIFVLGGSTTAGYPYESNLMFSRILHKRLADAFPERLIEVVNVATAAINTYSVLDFTDEVLAHQPDALLIYAGHNEFYGALGVASAENLGRQRWFIKLYLQLKGYKTFLLMRDAVAWMRKKLAALLQRGSVHDPTATLMERLVAEQQIPLDSELYHAGLRQFEANLSEILQKAQRAGVQVLLSELVSNVRDQHPFVSVKTDRYPEAETVWQEARRLEQLADFEAAREKYNFAKDLDALRFRAAEEFNEVIHRVAQSFQVPVVPMKRYFEAASPHGLIGENLMLEHLHPNIRGYFLMADAFFETMKNQGFIAPQWPAHHLKPAAYYRKIWGHTELDSLYGDLRVRILKGGWPFQPKATPNRALLDYRPTTMAESLAVKVWQDDHFNLERAHVALADYYEKRGDYLAAYREFNALICLTPYNSSPYLRAADVLIKAKQFDAALPLLYESLEREETAFANKWIGTILLNRNQAQQALPYLEKAHAQNRSDPQLLYNLSGAYALTANYQKARDALDELDKIAPDFPDAGDLRRQLDRILRP